MVCFLEFWGLGSRHWQAEQYCVLTLLPQQSPPSQTHASLLLPSSQYSSLIQLMSSHPLASPLASEQQSIPDSKPREPGQLFDPQKRTSRHSSWESQSPSFSEQTLHLQNPFSPMVKVSQLTEMHTVLSLRL